MTILRRNKNFKRIKETLLLICVQISYILLEVFQVKRFLYEDVKKIIEENGDYQLLSEKYVNGKEKLLVKHSCGNVYSVSFKDFQAGSRCPKCSNKKKGQYLKKTKDDFIKDVNDITNEFTVVGDYINNNTPKENTS